MKILEIIKQVEYSGVLFGLTNKLLYHEVRSTLQGAVLGSTSQLFLDNKFRLKNDDAALQFGFREISRYSRHLSSAEPDVGCVYTIILYNDEPSI